MGLDATVGALAQHLDDPGREWQRGLRKRLRVANRYLRAADLPRHREPERLDARPTLSLGIGSYGALHWLRRLAAHLRAGLEPEPWPVLSNPVEDPCYEAYRKEAVVRLELGPRFPFVLPGESEFARLRSAPAPGPTFDHLVFHSDCDGFYLPIDFDFVLATVEEGIDLIGSSNSLERECEVIAAFLGLPLTLHPESKEIASLDEGDPGPGAPRWQRFGTESRVCVTLHHLATRSIELGAALVFH